MERYSMLLGWKNQYCKNGHTAQSNLQIQCNPYQITQDIFHRTGINNPKLYMEPQKTQNCQGNSEEQKPSRKHNSPRLQAILQSHSHQDSVDTVKPPALPPVMTTRCGSASPARTAHRAASMQSSTSATPHWPRRRSRTARPKPAEPE